MTRADLPMIVGPYATAPPPETNTCEAQLADALILLGDVGALLNVVEAELATMTGERDVALASLGATVAALATMTTEREAALAKLAAILVIAGGN